jgi:hypothetical protein
MVSMLLEFQGIYSMTCYTYETCLIYLIVQLETCHRSDNMLKIQGTHKIQHYWVIEVCIQLQKYTLVVLTTINRLSYPFI